MTVRELKWLTSPTDSEVKRKVLPLMFPLAWTIVMGEVGEGQKKDAGERREGEWIRKVNRLGGTDDSYGGGWQRRRGEKVECVERKDHDQWRAGAADGARDRLDFALLRQALQRTADNF